MIYLTMFAIDMSSSSLLSINLSSRLGTILRSSLYTRSSLRSLLHSNQLPEVHDSLNTKISLLGLRRGVLVSTDACDKEGVDVGECEYHSTEVTAMMDKRVCLQISVCAD